VLALNNPESQPTVVQPRKLGKPVHIFLTVLGVIVCLLSPLAGVLLVIGLVLYRKYKHLSLPKLLIGILVLSTLAGLVLGWAGYRLRYERSLVNYSYSATDEFKLASETVAGGLAFQKPSELSVYYQNYKAGASVAGLSHSVDKDGQKRAIGYLAASSTVNTRTQSPQYLELLASTFAKPDDPSYKSFTGPLQKFAADYLPKTLEVSLSDPKPFSSANISKNAWRFDLNARPKSDEQGTLLKGVVLMAAGKNSFYYFMLASVDYNWTPNQAIWQQTLDSIKLDQ